MWFLNHQVLQRQTLAADREKFMSPPGVLGRTNFVGVGLTSRVNQVPFAVGYRLGEQEHDRFVSDGWCAERRFLGGFGVVSTFSTSHGGSKATPTGAGGEGSIRSKPSSSLFGASRRQRGLPWVALGVLMMAMSTLGFALWSMQQASRSPVLVAKVDIVAGATIGRSDVQLVSVGADPGLSVMGADRVDVVLGATARATIPMGTPLSEALLITASEQVQPGEAVVGASLEPGEYPTPRLGPGDRVGLVAVALGSTSSDETAVQLGEGVVRGAKALDDFADTRLFVSLVVPQDIAPEVADAAAGNRLRLVLLGHPS